MNFFDRLWTPQSSIPDNNYLIGLVIFDLLVLIVIYLIYLKINFQIKRSLRGPAHDSKIRVPSILKESLNMIFIGLFLIALSPLLTHISGFFSYHCLGPTGPACYLLIGLEDFVTLAGVQLTIIGLYNFYHELSRTKHDEKIQFGKFSIILFGVLLSLFILIINSSNNAVLIRNQIILISFVFGIFNLYFLIKMIEKYSKRPDNPLIKIRKIIIFLAISICLLFPIILYPLMVPKSGYIPTQNEEVEIYNLLGALLSLTIATVVKFAIYLPDRFLLAIGYTKKDLLEYMDHRFDEPSKYVQKVKQLQKHENLPPSDLKYVMAYEKDESILIDQLLKIYNGEMIEFSQMDETTIRKLMLPNSDIIYLDAHNSRNSSYLLQRANRIFSINLEYNSDNIIFSGDYEFADPEISYAVILIHPSYWNYKRKFWLVQFNPKQSMVILEFLKDYRLFIENLAYGKHIATLILRFKRQKDGNLQKIPPIMTGLSSPDPDYIEIL